MIDFFLIKGIMINMKVVSKMIKKRLAPILILIVLALTLTACSGSENKTAKDPGTIISEDQDTLTIIDQAGRTVTVDKDPDSIAVCYRVAIRFLLSLDQGDQITGVGKTEDFLVTLQPSLAECTDVGQGVADIEALAKLSPDLFIHKASDTEALDAAEKIDIPAVGISVETPEEIIIALDLLGKVCGESEKADALISYYEEQIADAKKRTENIEERPTAIVMGSSIGKVASAEMLQGSMLECAGADNCADQLNTAELWPTVGTEQIFTWDPDYIFISNSQSAVYSVDDLYTDPVWSELKAVRERHVFLIPAQADSWEFPGVGSVLGIDYMIHIMHPELMSEDELTEKVDAFYQLSYGRTFDRSELGY